MIPARTPPPESPVTPPGLAQARIQWEQDYQEAEEALTRLAGLLVDIHASLLRLEALKQARLAVNG